MPGKRSRNRRWPDQTRLATTDFYQFGTSSAFGRFSLSTDAFLIDHSNEQVYIPDDGSFEFKGPSRAYGFEGQSVGATGQPLVVQRRVDQDCQCLLQGRRPPCLRGQRAPFCRQCCPDLELMAGFSGSLRMRAINHFRLDGDDASIAASGHSVFDLGPSRRLSPRVELNLSLDNLTNRAYYETQNYFESRVTPDAPVVARIHATPAYPLTAVVGLSCP